MALSSVQIGTLTLKGRHVNVSKYLDEKSITMSELYPLAFVFQRFFGENNFHQNSAKETFFLDVDMKIQGKKHRVSVTKLILKF